MTPTAVTVVPHEGLLVGDEILRVVSGTVHYWRHERADWERVLDAVVSLGFRVVETYVPWSVHEQADGTFDYTGERDVEHFLRLAADRGLRVLIRPGPHINAELADFGYPRRVLWDPACQARGNLGGPVIHRSRTHIFPVPSYSSSAFYAEVQRWFDDVLPRLATHQWPAGPIVAIQLDNEMAYFNRLHPFAADYHPESVAAWREQSGFDGPAPIGPDDDPARIASWVRFRETDRHQVFVRLGEMVRRGGMDRVPTFHNDIPWLFGPLDPAELESVGAVDIAGVDIYVDRESAAAAKHFTRAVAGSSVLPFIMEFGAGWIVDPTFPHRIMPPDEEIALLAALLCGARALNFYMIADREHWYGAPISRQGELRPDDALLYRRLHDFMDAVGWWDLRRVAPVLLLRNKDAERWIAARQSCGEALSILEGRQFPLDLLDSDDGAAARAQVDGFATTWREHLEAAGLDFDEGSSDAVREPLAYELVVVPTTDDAAPHIAHPRVVTTLPDEATGLPTPAFRHDGAPGVSLHHLMGGGRELLGVLNMGAEPTTVTVTFEGTRHFVGRWRPGDARGDGSVALPLGAHSGQIWEVTA